MAILRRSLTPGPALPQCSISKYQQGKPEQALVMLSGLLRPQITQLLDMTVRQANLFKTAL
jgi:hypothetical protein